MAFEVGFSLHRRNRSKTLRADRIDAARGVAVRKVGPGGIHGQLQSNQQKQTTPSLPSRQLGEFLGINGACLARTGGPRLAPGATIL